MQATQLSERSQAWINWVLITSIPLRQFDAAENPVGMASGCLIDYAGRRFLLSVQHAVKRESVGWVIDLGYEPGRGTAIYRPHSFKYVAEMIKGSGVIRDVDFCFTEVAPDLVSTYAHRTLQSVSDVRPRHIFNTDLLGVPDANQIFGFAGEVKAELHGPSAVATEMTVYPGLRFVRTEDGFHTFQLPVPHPGHEFFKGCSGAPIVDMNRQVVALVCNGEIDSNAIRGVSVSRFKFAIDFFCKGVSGA